MIRSTNRIEVRIECDACGIAHDVAAGEKPEELKALSEELRRKPGWREINGRDVCPKCAVLVEKVWPAAPKEARK
jgi:hypothetical protein